MKAGGNGATASGEEARVRAAFSEEERRVQIVATRVRLVTLAAISVWITFENVFPEVLFYYALVALFAVLGVLPVALRRRGLDAPWQRYVFPLLDAALFTAAVLLPNPLAPTSYTPQIRLRFDNEIYLLVFLAGALFSYSPRVVLVTGLGTAAIWAAAVLFIYFLPESHGMITAADAARMSPAELVAAFLHPDYVNVGKLGRIVVVLTVTSFILATSVRRSRALALRQARTERERANLSRYFSPNLVGDLAHSDADVRRTRRQDVAVLFVDIVGFTAFCSGRPAEEVIGLLRDFHPRMARIVFAHGGTLDKYLGDGFMATFGTPRPAPHDARNALRCGRALLAAVVEWNEERGRRGEAPIRVGVGVHYGPVVVGDVGEEHFEFAVLGDTVNVASRLQELTRMLDAEMLVSGEAIRAAGLDDRDRGELEPVEPQSLRGREGWLEVWRHPRLDSRSA